MMKVHYGTKLLQPLRHAVVTSGTFDGVHVGHQKILHRLKQITQQNIEAESVVITFWPHPRLVLFPEQTDLKLLNSIEEKIELLQSYGIDHFLILPFNEEFAKWTSNKFIQEILIEKLNTKRLVIGYDHRFGRNREGSFDYLKANENLYGFKVEEIPRHDVDDIGVSSTKIRNALFTGNITTANKYLGSIYRLTGRVTAGEQLGREIGYPTANLIPIEPAKLIPADGIYAVQIRHRQKIYKGMLYIGKRTTLGTNLEGTIEVNIFDFQQTIYGEELTIYFIKYLRGERTFTDIQELKTQLATDKVAALEALQKN